MYPIWIKDGKNERPKTRIYYELAANGLYLHKETPFWNATVPVKQISILEKETATIELLLPPIPVPLTRQLAHFFAWAYDIHGTEAMALLWWKEKTQTYTLIAPPQEASVGSVYYEIPTPPPGLRLMGSFHSHNSMREFHSGTDQCDEKSFDGIHGTFGRFSSSYKKNNAFGLSVQAVVNGTRFPLEPVQWLMGLEKFETEPLEIIDTEKSDTTENPGIFNLDFPPPKDTPQVLDKKKIPGLFSNLLRPLGSYWDDKDKFTLSGKTSLLPYNPPRMWVENLKVRKYGILKCWGLSKPEPHYSEQQPLEINKPPLPVENTNAIEDPNAHKSEPEKTALTDNPNIKKEGG